MMKKHAIIPIFIPHSGCENDCIFCNQRQITARAIPPTEQQVRDTVEAYLSTLAFGSVSTVEMAFFGGSFTGLPLEEQSQYLSIANEYKRAGRIQKIHLSTRPDYIDETILTHLKRYQVDIIELGVQSFDEEVLRRSNRGHNTACVFTSVDLLRRYGFEVGIQLMIGLPGDTLEKDLYSARELVKAAPSIARLYPTIVLPDTPLYQDAASGAYLPLSLEEAVQRTKEMVKIIEGAGIQIIRIGLKSSDIIHRGEGSTLKGDTYHPAFRQLVEGELARDFFEDHLKLLLQHKTEKNLSILFASGKESYSNMVGHQKKNKKYFAEKYPCVKIEYIADSSLEKNQYYLKEDIE